MDHGRLISICFTVISHNSSIAGCSDASLGLACPSASSHCLPAGIGSQLSLVTHSTVYWGFPLAASKRSALLLRCLCSVSQLLCCFSQSSSRVFCHFLHILSSLKCILHWVCLRGLEYPGYDLGFWSITFLCCMCACKHHIPISETWINAYPSFKKPDYASLSTQKETKILLHEYILSRFLTTTFTDVTSAKWRNRNTNNGGNKSVSLLEWWRN